MADIDTLHLHLTHQELKELLRRRFARAGVEPPIFAAIDEIARLIRRHGFTACMEGLKLAIQTFSPPPVLPVDFVELPARTKKPSPTLTPGCRR
jgi:hypothetical protein